MKRNNIDLKDRVLYEDNHLLVINKLPGEIVQGDKTGDTPLSDHLKSYLKEKYHKPGKVFLGVIHRLDRPVSGLVAFARTSKSLARMNELLKERSVRKVYWAVSAQPPTDATGTLVHYLRRNEAKNLSYAYDHEVPGSQRAELDYALVARSDRYCLLEVNLKTGRHHQIRAQLAAIGCPIKGDLKYGFPRSNPDGSIHLHSRYLEFLHPVKKEIISLTGDPPDDVIWNYFISLSK